MIVISLICACLKSAYDSISRTNINIACNLSIESLFAGYSKPLLDDFDVMYLENSNELPFLLDEYLKENTEASVGVSRIKSVSSEIQEITVATDRGGQSMKEEVLKYMKYGIITDIAQMLESSDKEVKKYEKTEELLSEVDKCEEYTTKAEISMLKFVKAVEGLDTNENGFKTIKNRPSACKGSFVKQIVTQTPSPPYVAVYDKQVLEAMTEKYRNVYEYINDIYISCEEIIKDTQEDKLVNTSKNISHYKFLYERNIKDLKELISQVIEQCDNAEKIAENYKKEVSKALEVAGSCKMMVEKEREVIGKELEAAFKQDLDEISDFSEDKNGMICKISEVLEGVRNNRAVLEKCNNILWDISDELTESNAEGISNEIMNCKNILDQLDYAKLEFDYSNVNFSSGQGTEVIKKIKKYLGSGLLGMVIEDDKYISDKQIDINNLSSAMLNQAGTKAELGRWMDILENVKDNVMYNEYILLKFNSFIDNYDINNHYIKNNSLLDYSVEYILNGKKDDMSNLESTLLKLVTFRTGSNMSYLLTDREKKEECYVLAAALSGSTGIPAVIRAVQYLIMGVWAMAEAIVDVKELCDGNRIKLGKSRDDWQLTLEHLMNKDLNIDKKDDSKNSSKEGLSYEDYLKILLFLEKPIYKYFRTMDGMELRMIEKGYKNFRMKDYIYSISAQAVFSISTSQNFFSTEMEYSY